MKKGTTGTYLSPSRRTAIDNFPQKARCCGPPVSLKDKKTKRVTYHTTLPTGVEQHFAEDQKTSTYNASTQTPSRSHSSNSRNDIRLLDNSADLVQDGLAHGHLLPDHGVVLVVGVVGVPQLAAAGELELHELVPELTLVPDTGQGGGKSRRTATSGKVSTKAKKVTGKRRELYTGFMSSVG